MGRRSSRFMRLEDMPEHVRALIADKAPDAIPVTRSEPQKRRHKFGVSAKELRTFDGIVFDSKWEMRVYRWLKVWIPRGVRITRQVPIILQEKMEGMRAIKLVVDFVIGDFQRDRIVTPADVAEHCVLLDAKGMLTTDFRIKHKLFKAKFGRALFLPKNVRDLERFEWRKHGINAL